MPPDLPPLAAGYVTTREGLHALAEHVLVPAALPGGGPHRPAGDRRRLRSASGRRAAGRGGGATSSTTATARPASPRSATPPVPRTSPSARRPRCTSRSPTPTRTDRSASSPTAGQVVVRRLVHLRRRGPGGGGGGAAPDDDPSEAQLWPEHFDLALSIGPEGRRANVGASPGDADHDAPYLYVGPWEPRPGGIWNEPWGASLGYEAIRGGSRPTGRSSGTRSGPSSD